MMEFEFEQLTDERYLDLQYLFKTVFQKEVTVHYLKKKYNTTHTGLHHVCYLAYYEGNPAGFYGIIPQVFEQNGEQLVGVHACDFITHPDYRGQKLSRQLGLKAYELCKEKGAKFVYGFQSEPSYASGKNLGWTDYAQFEVYEVDVSTLPLINISNRLGINKWYEELTKYVLAPYHIKSFKNSQSSNKEALHVNYDNHFIAYKSFTNNHCIRIADVDWWIKFSNSLVVGDVNFESPEQFFASLKELKSLAFKLGCRKIYLQSFPGTLLYQTLKSSNYTSKKSWIVGYKLLDPNFELTHLCCNAADFDTF